MLGKATGIAGKQGRGKQARLPVSANTLFGKGKQEGQGS